ncbi:hypothetical protein ZIOFF_023598 [Zingiber officinale]|uniref:Uncharacterized protein n=1 Tax=Zingiber officinale TaxID=94328 RepID=A0A8J5L5N5_ZINOF|nr:hypothetical protein ZIOFF_023598 [Zingiber officinale]
MFGLHDSWSILLQHHRFLLTMLTLLAILCTIYLYFAITFGVAIDSCTGLLGAKKAMCQAKALEVKKFKQDHDATAAHGQTHFGDNKNYPDSAEFIYVVQALKGDLHPQRFQHTTETYACMILRLGLVGNIEEMEILLNEMIKLQLDNTNQVFGSMIDYFCVNCREVEALLVFRYSILAKQQSSISTCNRLLDTFSL